MLSLILAIACSSSIALLFKHTETRDMNRYAVTTANYFAAVIISLILLGTSGWSDAAQLDLATEWDNIIGAVESTERLQGSASDLWALIVGGVAGLIFFLGFIYYQVSIRRHGMSLASAFIKLGIFVPMLLSLLFWREYPSVVQWIGIGLAVVSILLVNWPTKEMDGSALRPALILLFLFGGLAEFSNKVFQKYGLQDDKSLFLWATFSGAFVFSLIATLIKRRNVTFRDILLGAMVGIPNLFASFFLIQALETIPAAVAFPLFGAGTIVIVNLAGVLVFREKLSKVEFAAISLAIVALVVINL